MRIAGRYPGMAMKGASANYYEILHVSRDAPLEIIRGSYRTLMQRMKHHPDLGGDVATAALINEAYAVLSNAEKRADYDARLAVMARVAEGVPGGREAEPDDQQQETKEEAPPVSRVLDWTQQCVFCETPHGYGRHIEVDTACGNCDSPLTAAGRQRIESAGQRAVDRVARRLRVNYYTEWPQARAHKGRVEDLSLNGLRLVTRQDLIEGQCIKIVSDIVQAVAQVTHTFHERRGLSKRCVAGVSFVTLRFGRSVGGFVSDRV